MNTSLWGHHAAVSRGEQTVSGLTYASDRRHCEDNVWQRHIDWCVSQFSRTLEMCG
jgi:hypothetical protein